jgi:hypothetical protein
MEGSMETLHAGDYIELVQILLSLVGSGAILSAYVPLKVQKYIPLLRVALNTLGANYLNAKNKD